MLMLSEPEDIAACHFRLKPILHEVFHNRILSIFSTQQLLITLRTLKTC